MQTRPTETQVWLDFARDCGYLSVEHHKQLQDGYAELGRMLRSPQEFTPARKER